MDPKPASRRRHGADVKSTVLAACSEPGTSVAAVALAHGLNANLVRKWLAGRGLKRAGVAPPVAPRSVGVEPITLPRPQPVLHAQAQFIPLALPPTGPAAVPSTAPDDAAAAAGVQAIHIELRRGPVHLTVHWPTSAATDCSVWLRELAAALPK